MSIYIKGMEMPKSCWDCPMMYDYLYCVVTMDKRLKEDTRADSCPLTEIPEPHGRLIDADAIFDEMRRYSKVIFDTGFLLSKANKFEKLNGLLEDAPTVIEGSE